MRKSEAFNLKIKTTESPNAETSAAFIFYLVFFLVLLFFVLFFLVFVLVFVLVLVLFLFVTVVFVGHKFTPLSKILFCNAVKIFRFKKF